jgi:multiple antibiotic resistance protein
MCAPFCPDRLLTDAVTFFVVVNPLGLVPLFIALTRSEPPSSRAGIASRGIIIAAIILVAFIAVGQIVLNAMGVSLASFRIAGGLVLLVIAMRMILEDEPAVERADADGTRTVQRDRDVAVFPLALPYIAGPGTIMAAMLLTDNDRFSIPQQAVTTAILFLVLAVTYGTLRAADAVHRLLGSTGANVLTRVMGLVLASLAVEGILAGIRGAFSLR